MSILTIYITTPAMRSRYFAPLLTKPADTATKSDLHSELTWDDGTFGGMGKPKQEVFVEKVASPHFHNFLRCVALSPSSYLSCYELLVGEEEALLMAEYPFHKC